MRKLLVWLTANKLIERKRKQGFVILSPTQERLTYQPKIIILDNEQNTNVAQERKEFVKYFGVLIDCYLSWKHHVDHAGSCQ